MPRQSGFARLQRHFHEHPKGRLHEFFFWAGIGVALGLFALVGWRAGFVNTPIALMLGVVSLTFVLWSLLPQHKGKPKPPVEPGRRSKRRD